MPKQVSRRLFLHTAVVGGGAAGLYYLGAFDSAPAGVENTSPLEPELFDFITGEQRFSLRLGALYGELLESDGVVYDELSLQSDIFSEASAAARAGDSLAERLRDTVQGELINGSTVELEGWNFPVTELKLSLLAYLLNGRALSSETESDEIKKRPDSVDELPLAELGEVDAWGPDSTVAGVPFNEQPNGNSALWFKVNGLKRGVSYAVFFGAVKMKSTVHFEKNLITADLYPDQAKQETSQAGEVPVYLVDTTNYRKQVLGSFEVFDGDDLPKKFLPLPKRLRITSWGPRQGERGMAFNPQPDGSAAFWLKYEGNLDHADKVYLGDIAMDTTHHFKRKLITATISPGALNGFDITGKLPVSIQNNGADNRLLVGAFLFK